MFFTLFFRYTWITNCSFFDVNKEGFQTLTIPKSGSYLFEVIGAGGYCIELSGARIKGKIRLERGDKITVALGQRSKGEEYESGSGATYVIKECENRPEPLFVAAGAGFSETDSDFSQACLAQTAKGNEEIGSSGVQVFQNGEKEDFYCAGAGFSKSPKIVKLNDKSEPPQNYLEGLRGGKGYAFGDDRVADCEPHELEGGFGGGGATFVRILNSHAGGMAVP